MGTASMVDRHEVLARIADEVRACRACPLHEGTRNAVPGEGNPDAEVMLIGEAPGQNEDLQGRPFVGASGQFLTQMLAAAGYAAAMLGANSDAEAWLTRALQADPRYTPASLVLGQVLYRQGRVTEAIDVYDAAVRYAPGDEIGRAHV